MDEFRKRRASWIVRMAPGKATQWQASRIHASGRNPGLPGNSAVEDSPQLQMRSDRRLYAAHDHRLNHTATPDPGVIEVERIRTD
jgi:hypothetical protein